MPNKYFVKYTGVIKASGADLIDFINRMSTNDLRRFPENEYRKTVLTTDKGRIIDLITVLNLSGQSCILTSNNFQDKVISHLSKYIIMDDVTLEKTDENFFHVIVTGGNLAALAKEVSDSEIGKNKIHVTAEGDFIFLNDFKIESLNIICKEAGIKKYKELLKNGVEQSCAEYELMRIDAGIAEGENELNDNINPMECGLDQYISFVKGCYIGQEVIARLDSQGKRPKQIVKIESDDEIKKDARIITDEKEVGFVSSSINHAGKNTGLGFIRSVNLDFDKEYFINSEGVNSKINISKIN